MACPSPFQPRIISSFLGDRLLVQSFKPFLYFKQGNKHGSVRLSRTMCNFVDILFNRRNQEEISNKSKRLRPGKVSPRLSVPDLILKPPYIKSRQSPGISTGPEIHDERGVEYMRAAGKLAAQVLNFAGTLVKGYHGDTSATFLCGDVNEEAKQLVQVTEDCLNKAISICGPGVEYNRIGRTIQQHADKYGFGVVQQFVGHGVGRVFHADPVILHFRNNERGGMILGQTFTIEPMLTMGSINPVIWADDWTAVTEDGSLSAQFEHTLLITENGVEILTRC